MRARSSMRGWIIVLVYLTAAVRATAGPSPLVVFLGDSLTAGYGLATDQAFPSLAAARMRERGMPIRVVNAGVSGDTTTGALERVDWLLRQKPDVVVVGIGNNDAFRGQPVERIEANLREIVARARSSGARVLILGMQVPPNYGPDYSRAFASVYAKVARESHADLMPFLLDGVAGRPELNQDDGIHPNLAGETIVADHLLPFLERVVKGK